MKQIYGPKGTVIDSKQKWETVRDMQQIHGTIRVTVRDSQQLWERVRDM